MVTAGGLLADVPHRLEAERFEPLLTAANVRIERIVSTGQTLLLQRGMILEDSLRFVLGYGDAHNELAWRRRIGGWLEFLLPPA